MHTLMYCRSGFDASTLTLNNNRNTFRESNDSFYKQKIRQLCNPYYLLSGALHYFNRNRVDFVMHLHGSSLPAANLYQKHTEVCSSKVQSKEISVLCIGSNVLLAREPTEPDLSPLNKVSFNMLIFD